MAISDELGLLASPLVVLDRRCGLAPVLESLSALAQRETVDHVVVGHPLNADGSSGSQARRAEHFARLVAKAVGLPVKLWDERLSTREAEDILRAQGRNLRRLRQRGQIDAVAAAVILQDYLEHGRSA